MAGATGMMAIHEGLRGLGYDDAHIRHEVPVDGLGILDLLAYSSAEIQDLSTTAIAAHKLDGDGDRGVSLALGMARDLAAPAALLADVRRVRLYSVSTREKTDQLVEDFEIGDAAARLRKYTRDLSPTSLSSKGSGRQLSFFPLDIRLLADARDRSAERLRHIVEEALSAATDVEQGDVATAVRAVVAAMALLVVRDRYGYASTTPAGIAGEATSSGGQVFQWLSYLPLEAPGTATALSALVDTADFGWLDGTCEGTACDRTRRPR